MQTRASSTFKNLSRKILHQHNHHLLDTHIKAVKPPRSSCDIFINHRSSDTKRTIAGLLYDHLSRLGHYPFLDSKSMKPGDKLFEKIDSAIKDCKIGVAVFSPRYCESKFCLHELALFMKTNKRFIPIFYDVKPSELQVKINGELQVCSPQELRLFSDALQLAKNTVGVTFDSHNGDWSEFLTAATDAIMKNIIEVDGDTDTSFKNRRYVVQNQYYR